MSTGKRAAIYTREGAGAAAAWHEEHGIIVLIPSPELARLMSAALREEFDVVVVQSLDRLADERVPLMAILKAVTATGVLVHAVEDDADVTVDEAMIRHPVDAAIHAALVAEWNGGTQVRYRVE